MSKDKDPKLNYHEEEKSMVTDFEDLKELGKEMEQISDQNDQEKNSEEDSQ
ncbi:TPA: SAS053 family protein [Staphylococcus aureus]